jgi:hypothetical protein
MPPIIDSGILGCVLIGFLIVTYVVVLNGDHVVRRDDYAHTLQVVFLPIIVIQPVPNR